MEEVNRGTEPGRSQGYVLQVVPGERRAQWDTFVSAHPSGHLLQSWSWGELKEGVGWHPLRLALWDTQQETIVAAAQILRRTAPRWPLWAGHLAYIPKGPVLDWSDTHLAKRFFSQVNRYLWTHGTIALRVEPNEMDGLGQQDMRKTLRTLRFRPVSALQPLRTVMLNLTSDEEALLAHMKEKWRYNVRLAGRRGVMVRVAETVEDVQAWYALLQTTGVRDQFGIHTFAYYLQAWRMFAPYNQARLLLAEHDGQLLAGIFVGLFAHQAIYLYGASSNEQRSLMPNYLLQWEAMRWAKGEGATHYDLWGIAETDDEHEALAGISRFKSGWGGEVVRFVGNYEHVYHPLAMGLARRFLSM